MKNGVAVKKADTANNGYHEQIVVMSEEIFCDSVKNIHSVGAYHSQSIPDIILHCKTQWTKYSTF
jgi:hypothetical protein